jgi:hypothetical protein
MAMSRRLLTACLAAAAMALAAPFLATATRGAQAGPSTAIHVAAGVQVHVSGSHAMLSRLGGGASVHGGYDCTCSAGGTGACVASFDTGKGLLTCGPASGNGCTKACVLSVTTLPDTAGGASRNQAAP